MYHDNYSGSFTVHNYANMKCWRIKPEHGYKQISLEKTTVPTPIVVMLITVPNYMSLIKSVIDLILPYICTVQSQ